MPVPASAQGNLMLHRSQHADAQTTGFHHELLQPVAVLIKRKISRLPRRGEVSVRQPVLDWRANRYGTLFQRLVCEAGVKKARYLAAPPKNTLDRENQK